MSSSSSRPQTIQEKPVSEEASNSSNLPWVQGAERYMEAPSFMERARPRSGEEKSILKRLPFEDFDEHPATGAENSEMPIPKTVVCSSGQTKPPIRGFKLDSTPDKDVPTGKDLEMCFGEEATREEEREQQQRNPLGGEGEQNWDGFSNPNVGYSEDIFPLHPTHASNRPTNSCFSLSQESELDVSMTTLSDTGSCHDDGTKSCLHPPEIHTRPNCSPMEETKVGVPIHYPNSGRSATLSDEGRGEEGEDEEELMISPSSPPKHQRYDLGKRFELDVSFERGNHSHSSTPSPAHHLQEDDTVLASDASLGGSTFLHTSVDDIFHMSHSKSPSDDEMVRIKSPPLTVIPMKATPLPLSEYRKYRSRHATVPAESSGDEMMGIGARSGRWSSQDEILQFSFSNKSSSFEDMMEPKVKSLKEDELGTESSSATHRPGTRPRPLYQVNVGTSPQTIPTPVPQLTPLLWAQTQTRRVMPRLHPLHTGRHGEGTKPTSEPGPQRTMPKLSPLPHPGTYRSMPQLKPISVPGLQAAEVSPTILYQMPGLKMIGTNSVPLPKLSPLTISETKASSGNSSNGSVTSKQPPKQMPKLFPISDTIRGTDLVPRQLPRLYPLQSAKEDKTASILNLEPQGHAGPKVITATKLTPTEISQKAGFLRNEENAEVNVPMVRPRASSEVISKPHPELMPTTPASENISSMIDDMSLMEPAKATTTKEDEGSTASVHPRQTVIVQPTLALEKETGEGAWFPCYYSGDLLAKKPASGLMPSQQPQQQQQQQQQTMSIHSPRQAFQNALASPTTRSKSANMKGKANKRSSSFSGSQVSMTSPTLVSTPKHVNRMVTRSMTSKLAAAASSDQEGREQRGRASAVRGGRGDVWMQPSRHWAVASPEHHVRKTRPKN